MGEWGYNIIEKERDRILHENSSLKNELTKSIKEKDKVTSYQMQDGTNEDMQKNFLDEKEEVNINVDSDNDGDIDIDTDNDGE